jgi:hypothetical protein
MPPTALGTANPAVAIAKKNSGRAVESGLKAPTAEEDLKKAGESGAQDDGKKR